MGSVTLVEVILIGWTGVLVLHGPKLWPLLLREANLLCHCLKHFLWEEILQPLILFDFIDVIHDFDQIFIRLVLNDFEPLPLFQKVDIKYGLAVVSESVMRQLLREHVITHCVLEVSAVPAVGRLVVEEFAVGHPIRANHQWVYFDCTCRLTL